MYLLQYRALISKNVHCSNYESFNFDTICKSCAVCIVRYALSTKTIAPTDKIKIYYGIGERQSENSCYEAIKN